MKISTKQIADILAAAGATGRGNAEALRAAAISGLRESGFPRSKIAIGVAIHGPQGAPNVADAYIRDVRVNGVQFDLHEGRAEGMVSLDVLMAWDIMSPVSIIDTLVPIPPDDAQ